VRHHLGVAARLTVIAVTCVNCDYHLHQQEQKHHHHGRQGGQGLQGKACRTG